jgi:hypothetical protein
MRNQNPFKKTKSMIINTLHPKAVGNQGEKHGQLQRATRPAK